MLNDCITKGFRVCVVLGFWCGNRATSGTLYLRGTDRRFFNFLISAKLNSLSFILPENICSYHIFHGQKNTHTDFILQHSVQFQSCLHLIFRSFLATQDPWKRYYWTFIESICFEEIKRINGLPCLDELYNISKWFLAGVVQFYCYFISEIWDVMKPKFLWKWHNIEYVPISLERLLFGQ